MSFIKMPCSVPIAVIAIVALIGCGNKNKQNDLKTASELASVNKKSGADTSDIFKEFYSDDSTGQEAVKKSSKKSPSKGQTFSPSSSASGEFSEHGRYVVQVSCVPSKSMAEKLAAALKEKNFPVYIAAVQNPTPKLSGTYYRVRIGGFSGLSAAKSFGQNSLVAAGYEYWVDKKSNDKVGMEGYGSGAGAPAKNPASSYESVAPAPSSWSSTPVATEPAKASSGTNFTPSDGFLPSTVPASETPPAAAVSAPSTPAPAATPAKVTPAPASPPIAAPVTPAPASPSTGKSAAGTGEWGTDSSSNTGGW
jgi:hypothetical protein